MDTAASFLWGEPPDVFPLCDVTERIVTLPAGIVVEAAPLDADRVFIGFYSDFPAFNAISVSLRPTLAANQAIQVAPTTPVEFTFVQHGPLVGQPWFAIHPGGFQVTVIEVLYRRRVAKPDVNVPLRARAESAYQWLARRCKGG